MMERLRLKMMVKEVEVKMMELISFLATSHHTISYCLMW